MRAKEFVNEKWSEKYKRSINCAHPKGFSQRAHCQGQKKNEDLAEFAPGGGSDSGDYFKTLASAWYNGVYDTGNLQKGIKSQEDIERLLQRGIVCPDGVTRRFNIGYNGTFDGVEIYSDDYYEHGDESGELDSRTGQPWGPYDHMEFGDDELDESLTEEQLDELMFKGSQCTKDCSGHQAGYEWSIRKAGRTPNSHSPSFNKGAAIQRAGL
jgi:hypothetical protein